MACSPADGNITSDLEILDAGSALHLYIDDGLRRQADSINPGLSDVNNLFDPTRKTVDDIFGIIRICSQDLNFLRSNGNRNLIAWIGLIK